MACADNIWKPVLMMEAKAGKQNACETAAPHILLILGTHMTVLGLQNPCTYVKLCKPHGGAGSIYSCQVT
jgi:hypothetical protein